MNKNKILEAIELLKSNNDRINKKKISDILEVSERTIANNWNSDLQIIVDSYNRVIGYPIYKSDVENEEFREVPGYIDYQISNFGRLLRVKNSRIRFLSGSINKNGYLTAILIAGKQRNFGLHQIVAMAFLEHTPNGWEIVVDHKDGNKLNNRLDNLRLVTARENTSFGYDKKETTSKYRGVHFRKNRNKWMSYIRINSKRIHLGHYDTEEEACQAYQKALKDI